MYHLSKIFFTFIFLLLSHVLTAQKVNISGAVTDTSGRPLAGITIRLEPDRHLTQTDEKGQFIIKNIYPGNYTLIATSVGFLELNQTVTVESNNKNFVAIRLEEGFNELDAVTVHTISKTSSPDNLINIQRGAMPVTVISRETIEKMGSRRLDEILKEQTGIAVVNDISGGARATGIQMQGFSSEYIMILIDGQPMVGRNSGSFDLSRISVTNIERIEIVKGASSCLFGSEALGGAINIVTRHGAIQPQALANIQYGSLNILDATLEGETPFHHNRGTVNLSANYYHSDGYNTDPNYIARGTTAPPYDDYSVQGRARYQLSSKGIIGMSGRYALRKSYMEKRFESQNGNVHTTGDRQDIADINLSMYYNHDFTNGLKSMSRGYVTSYLSDMSVMWQQQNNDISSEKFRQTLYRFEQQFAYAYNSRLKFTGGLGAGLETMNTNAYTEAGNMATYFSYLQLDWLPSANTEIMGGIRYDGHNNYGGKLNPSIGLQRKLNSIVSFRVSAGTGFKAPDFKNRFQVFVNPTSNYMVIGTEVLASTLAQLQNAGEISEIRQYLFKQIAGNLQPERSVSLNTGFIIKPAKNLKFEVGGFYHHLTNQIYSVQVATGTGNRLIFSYQNLPKSYNTGFEGSFSWAPISNLEISGGYQFLISKDRSVKDSILAGNFPWNKVRNNNTGETFTARPSDYWGIENRSRHMANLRIMYSIPSAGINISFRTNYRGKYAFGDANNNNFIDKYDHFVNGYLLLNASIEKKLLQDRLSIRLTADNINDYTDRLIPGQPGRIILFGASYRFQKY
jgi:outer membrane receptor for ferrienterochelin and colicins